MFSTDQIQPEAQGQEILGDLRNQPLRAQRMVENGSVGEKKKREKPTEGSSRLYSQSWSFVKLTLCRAGSHDFSSVAQSCLTLCNPMGCSTQTPRVYSHYLAQANQYSLSSSYSHWFRDGHMTQDSQSRLRGISRDFVGTFGEMGFSTPTTSRLGAVIMGIRSNWAEDGAEKAEPEMEKWQCCILNLTVVFG